MNQVILLNFFGFSLSKCWPFLGVSVLGLLLCFVYILSEDDLNCFHGIEYHLCAGDSQISILALHSELQTYVSTCLLYIIT